MSVEAIKNARELLLEEYRAILSTRSRKRPGFPFGSVVLYCLDAEGRSLILISRIAQHTHSLQTDPHCSMLIGECGAEDIQAVGRLILLAETRQLAEEEVAAAAERCYHYFPESTDYHRVHDFDFWVLQPVQWRFTDGFDAIHWLAAKRVSLANPFAGEAERGMVEHTDKDHATAIIHYVELAGLPAHVAAQLARIDTEGFHLCIGQGLHWPPSLVAYSSLGTMHRALAQLARVKRWPTVEPEQG